MKIEEFISNVVKLAKYNGVIESYIRDTIEKVEIPFSLNDSFTGTLIKTGIDNNNEDGQYEELMGDDETDLSIEPINEYNTHEPTFEEAKEWNEAYEKGYSLGYENGKNERNPAWSEEDEERIKQICEDLKCGLENFRSGKSVKGLHFEEIINSNINWLKSLKPHPHWKPTEEQMENLEYAINMVDKCCEDSLQSLYNDLKKL